MRIASRGALSNISNHNTADDDDDNLLPLSQVLSDNDDDGDFEADESMTLDEAVAQQVLRISTGVYKENVENEMSAKKVSSKVSSSKRRRRRSSARFLRLSGKFDEDMLEDATVEPGLTSEQLGEIYQKAIRLNAENKINGQNTWGLNLIDNMDKIVTENGNTAASSTSNQAPVKKTASNASKVNFTKASCTLDASVKIYSYRVDDVHLSSYKVLANMNRTGPGNKDGLNDDDDLNDDGRHDDTSRSRSQRKIGMSSARGESTLCSNVSSLNVSKLDLSYNVDPLFHKMSKEFDEGGARGLLLNNLCVSRHGCNIQFDSKEEELNESKVIESNVTDEEDGKNRLIADSVDITGLVDKLDSMLNGQTMSSLQFLPQLQGLRRSLADLEEEGFTNDMLPKTPKVSNLD